MTSNLTLTSSWAVIETRVESRYGKVILSKKTKSISVCVILGVMKVIGVMLD